MIWRLYSLEIFKMARSLVTWITFLCFLVLVIFLFGSYYYNGLEHGSVSTFRFPRAWPRVLTDGASLAATFSAVLIALMTASEFDWRTSRQNVIDGLSKGQWFSAKLLLLPTVAICFYSTELIIAGALAWVGTEPGTSTTELLSSAYFISIAGVFTGIICYASIALLLSLLTRSAGPALGFTLVYQVFEIITTRTLRGLDFDRLADCFPFQVHMAMFRYEQYLPAGSEARMKMDILWDTSDLFAACIGWIIAFVLVAWVVYWKRDL